MADEPGRGGRRRRRGRPSRPARIRPLPLREDDDLALDAILLHRSRRRRRRPVRHRALLAVAAALFLLLIAVATGAAFTGHAVLTRNCTLADLRPISIGENSFVFASDGSLLGVVPSSKNRQPLKLDAISPWLPKATIAVEDRRFWEHGALDYQGILRAAIKNLEAGRIVEGGSTITQELVRNLYIGSHERTLKRKVREACLSLKLAKIWSKQQILAAYMNEVFYGRHAYGAEAAAQTFFSTSARRLTLAQAALLAGLPQAPSLYDPLRHPDVALRRRDEVLRAMLQSGAITAQQYSDALAQPLGLAPGTLYADIRHPNFFGYVEQQLVELYGRRRVQAGGLRVRTTVEPKLQAAAREAIASTLLEKTDPAAALVAIDPKTGAVKAMVNYLPSGRKLQFSLASQGHRQAGSAFKPFTLATAMTEGVSLSSTFSGPPSLTISDPRCSYNGELWEVHNYADETAGTMDLTSALAHSVNTIFAQLVVKVGPSNVADVAHRMGIMSPLQSVCSITLGSQAVTPLEMASGFATLAARGVHHPPQALALVRGPNDKIIGRLKTKGERAIPQNAADLVTYALQRVVTGGTGTGAALYSRPVAGKTGTAEDYRDAWFCGFVPQLVTCVWVGYPHVEKSMYNVEGYSVVFGGSLPATIWRRFMEVATEKLPVIGFPTPIFTGHAITGSGAYSSDYGSSGSETSTSTSSSEPSAPAPAPQVETVHTPSPPPPAPAPPPPPPPAPAPPPPPPPEPPPPPPTEPPPDQITPPPSRS